jgi:hypothetical protein
MKNILTIIILIGLTISLYGQSSLDNLSFFYANNLYGLNLSLFSDGAIGTDHYQEYKASYPIGNFSIFGLIKRTGNIEIGKYLGISIDL